MRYNRRVLNPGRSNRRSLTTARRRLIALSLVGFAFRALIPAGFMPAPLSDGGPIEVCHGGMAGAFFKDLAERRAGPGHMQHASAAADMGVDAATAEHGNGAGHESPAEHAAWEHCAIGAVLVQAALAGEVHIYLLSLDHVTDWIEPSYSSPTPIPGSYRARAPPAS